MRRLAIASSALVIAIAIAFGCTKGMADPAAPKQVWRDGTGQPVASLGVASGASLAPLVKAVKPAVVNISTTTVTKNPHPFLRGPRPGGDDDEDFFRFFGPRQPREFKGQSLGSGFLIHPEGYVLTNNHVVENASDIKVTLADGKEYEAKVIGRDKATDVALIKLEKAAGLPTVALGDSDALEQGDYVVALGSPFGFKESVSFGIVSAKDRSLNSTAFDDFIQTDAAINQGNSGGPLFNLKGEVVGINTAIISPQLGQGLGFAVPVNMAKALIPQLLQGKVARGYLGVTVGPLTPDLAQGFGLPAGATGALIQNVQPGSPAEKAGVQAGDVVTSVNGQKVETPSALTRAVAAVRPNGKVALDVIRSGKKKSLAVVVAQRPDEDKLAAGGGAEDEPQQPGGAEKPQNEKLGLRVKPLNPELARELGVQGDQGVVVVAVSDGGPAEKAGIQRGDLVLEVRAGERVSSVAKVEDLVSAVAKSKVGDTVVLRIRRGPGALFVPVKIGGEKKK